MDERARSVDHDAEAECRRCGERCAVRLEDVQRLRGLPSCCGARTELVRAYGAPWGGPWPPVEWVSAA